MSYPSAKLIKLLGPTGQLEWAPQSRSAFGLETNVTTLADGRYLYKVGSRVQFFSDDLVAVGRPFAITSTNDGTFSWATKAPYATADGGFMVVHRRGVDFHDQDGVKTGFFGKRLEWDGEIVELANGAFLASWIEIEEQYVPFFGERVTATIVGQGFKANGESLGDETIIDVHEVFDREPNTFNHSLIALNGTSAAVVWDYEISIRSQVVRLTDVDPV